VTPPAAAAAPAVHPRRPLAPRGPRRVSGPARPSLPARPARSRRAGRDAGFALGLISALESLAQHRLLDRLIRGRTWIGIVAFALIGIVTLQLGLLKLNGGIGRALQHEALLQRENAALSIENSELAAASRVQARAAQLGMAFVPAGGLRFLSPSSHGDVAKAASALSSTPASASGEGREATTQPSEASPGAQSPALAEGTSTQASNSEATGESAATSGQGAEAASSESSSGRESASSSESSAGVTSPPPASEAESSSGASPETGAGGGVQASTPGG
jgi:cell division protein FtsL